MLIKKISKSFLLFFFLIIICSKSDAQIDIRSKVDAETYSNYSRAIDLFEKITNLNDVVTLFIPLNSNSLDNFLLTNKVDNAKEFVNKHTINGVHTLYEFKNSLVNLNELELVNLKLDKLFVSKNLSSFIIADKISTEANVMKELSLDSNHHLIFLMGSLINY